MDEAFHPDWRARLKIALTVYLRPRLLLILALGFASGLPFLITSSTLAIRLRETGIDLGAIGLFSLVGIPYALKFIWAPMLDLVRPPGLFRGMGLRRSWILLINILLVGFIALLGLVEPTSETIIWVALIALAVSFLSATQDVAIDAYRIELLKFEEYGAGAAMAVYGFRIGMLMATAGTLYLAEGFNWETAYTATGATLLIAIIAICFAPEPPRGETPDKPAPFGKLVFDAYWEPLKEFMGRRGWVAVLAFVLIFKFGDALLSQMTGPLYIDLGFDKFMIANVSKIFGFVAIMVGTFVGGLLVVVWTLGRVLFVAGLLQALSNLGFWYLYQFADNVGKAAVADGAATPILAWVIGFENFASGLSQTAFVAFVMILCNKQFAATHFAFITSIMAFSPKVMVAPAGFVAEWLGWGDFILLTAFVALPGLALLIWMRSIYPDVWRDQYSKEN